MTKSIQCMKYVSNIDIFPIGGSQTLPITSEQWNGKYDSYGSVQVKCTNIAGKAFHTWKKEKLVALSIFIIVIKWEWNW